MSVTAWVVAGVMVRSPVAVVTNLFLALECAWLASRLASGSTAAIRRRAAVLHWRGRWRSFLAWTALGAAAGALKHGLSGGSEGALLEGARFASNAATGLAAVSAALATVEVRCGDGRLAMGLRRSLLVGATGFLPLTLADPRFHVVLAASSLCLTPVLVAELVAWLRGSAAAGWLAGGLAVFTLTGAAYLLRLSAGPWLDHVDLAHLLVMVGVALVWRGASLEPYPTASAGDALEVPCPST